jgi:hypothetical protein
MLFRFFTRIESLVLTALVATSCSTNDAPPSPPHGPEDFAILQVSGATSGVAGPDGTLAVTCDEPLLVWVGPESDGKIGDFQLEPPGKCGDNTNCGWIELSAVAAGSIREVITSAQSPLRLDLPAALRDTTIQLHAELRDSDGAPVMRTADAVLAADLVLTVSSDCAAATNP